MKSQAIPNSAKPPAPLVAKGKGARESQDDKRERLRGIFSPDITHQVLNTDFFYSREGKPLADEERRWRFRYWIDLLVQHKGNYNDFLPRELIEIEKRGSDKYKAVMRRLAALIPTEKPRVRTPSDALRGLRGSLWKLLGHEGGTRDSEITNPRGRQGNWDIPLACLILHYQGSLTSK